MRILSVLCVYLTLVCVVKCVRYRCMDHRKLRIHWADEQYLFNPWPGNEDNKFLFDSMSTANKTFYVQLRKRENDTVDSEQMIKLNESNTTPSLWVGNRSWHFEYPLGPLEELDKVYGLGWKFSLNREQLQLRMAWLPKESFGMKVELKLNILDRVNACAVLTDTLTEPILQWKLGERVLVVQQNDDDLSPKVLMSTSTCTNEVAVQGFRTFNATAVIFLGVTYAGFSPGTITWYKLFASDIGGENCTALQLFDMALMNRHLVLATDLGLFFSNDITMWKPERFGMTPTRTIKWKKVHSVPRQSIASSIIGYTPVCQWRHHEIIREDYITYSFRSNESDFVTTLYSWHPFTTWVNPLEPNDDWLHKQLGLKNGEVIGALYNEHTHNLAMLARIQVGAPLAPEGEDAPGFALNQASGEIFNLTDENRNQVFQSLKNAPSGTATGGTTQSRSQLRMLLTLLGLLGDVPPRVNTFVTTTYLVSVPLNERTNLTQTRLNFPVFAFNRHRFPDEQFPLRITYVPGFYIMHAHGGRNIYASENGGASWSLLYKADRGDIVYQWPSCKSQGVFTLMTFDAFEDPAYNPYVLYLGRPGIPRLGPTQPEAFNKDLWNWIHIDEFGEIYIMVQEGNNARINKTKVDVVLETLRVSEINFPVEFKHGLAVAFMSGNELVALEHRDRRYYEKDTESYFQNPRHLNRVFSGRLGGQMILRSISYDNLPHPDYLARLKFHMLEPFRQSTGAPALNMTLRIEPGIRGWDGARGDIPEIDDSLHVSLHLEPRRPAFRWRDDELGQTLITKDATYFVQARNTRRRRGNNTGFMSAYGKRISKVGPALQKVIVKEPGEWLMFTITGQRDNRNNYFLREDISCRNLLKLSDLDNPIVELDVTERFGFKAIASSNGIPVNERDAHVVASMTHAQLLRSKLELKTLGYPPEQHLTFSARSVLFKKGITAIRVRAARASLVCQNAIQLIEIFNGCPCGRHLKFNYPSNLQPEDFLTTAQTNPRDTLGQPLLFDLEVNYRPPSEAGVMIPTSDHIYNVDPEEPRPRNMYKVSKETGRLKQCFNATTRRDCGCTVEDQLSDDPAASDCKQRVFRLVFTGVMRPEFVIKRPDCSDVTVDANLAVRLTELNNRTVEFYSEDPGFLLRLLAQDSRFNSTDFYNPADVQIRMNTSGLFHFKAELIPGLSFCAMTTHFMAYVDDTPLAEPLNYIVFFATSLVIGFVLFVVFLGHVVFSPPPPDRITGPRNPAVGDMMGLQGKYQPPEYPRQRPTDLSGGVGGAQPPSAPPPSARLEPVSPGVF